MLTCLVENSMGFVVSKLVHVSYAIAIQVWCAYGIEDYPIFGKLYSMKNLNRVYDGGYVGYYEIQGFWMPSFSSCLHNCGNAA
jgi:hypothetical protein